MCVKLPIVNGRMRDKAKIFMNVTFMFPSDKAKAYGFWGKAHNLSLKIIVFPIKNCVLNYWLQIVGWEIEWKQK